jgi:hypothetical protein
MSVRPSAPYKHEVREDGAVLIYEGHDEPKKPGVNDPKSIDQPEVRQNGSLTENGKFHKAAQDHKAGRKGPDIVQVYEKIKAGIWSDNGYFHLVDSWKEYDGNRNVFKFKLVATDELHFDHIVPFSKGGTSLKAENIRLLCARHNLQKSARIQ